MTKWKAGVEATYSVLAWMALSGRFDYVVPDTQDLTYAFSVISPRIILRTDWMATDQIVMQYSHWNNGANTLIRVGDPPLENINLAAGQGHGLAVRQHVVVDLSPCPGRRPR